MGSFSSFALSTIIDEPSLSSQRPCFAYTKAWLLALENWGWQNSHKSSDIPGAVNDSPGWPEVHISRLLLYNREPKFYSTCTTTTWIFLRWNWSLTNWSFSILTSQPTKISVLVVLPKFVMQVAVLGPYAYKSHVLSLRHIPSTITLFGNGWRVLAVLWVLWSHSQKYLESSLLRCSGSTVLQWPGL